VAKKPLEVILEEISEALKDLEQGALFTSVEEKHKVLSQACVKYLRYKGFKVVEPDKPTHTNISKLDDLIFHFYGLSDRLHPELKTSYRNLAQHRKLASALVKSRMDACGYGFKAALQECAEIIDTIFNHEAEFNFTVPISFGILGQKNCGWITDKAIQIINKNKLKTAEERRKKYIEDLEKVYDAEPDGFGDLDEIERNLD